MDTINVDDFARQLIADKCSALIESENMLPSNILSIVKNARDEYFNNPSNKNYENIKKLFSQTKYVDDAIDYKDFNRRILLIAFKFALNKSKQYFKNYKSVLEVALKRLDGINPDLKSSPRAMLQHYNECLENLDNPRNNEHHLVTFAKEIATKIFIETIDLYSYGNKSPFETHAGYTSVTSSAMPLSLTTTSSLTAIATTSHNDKDVSLLANAIVRNKKSPKINSIVKPYKVVTPLFVL